jgi:hypothetical protein
MEVSAQLPSALDQAHGNTGLASVGFGHYRQKLSPVTSIDSDHEGPEKATRGGVEWEPIKNSSRELDLYLQIDPTRLSSDSIKTI